MSDIAAYVYCPISAVISKTLVIKELSIEYNESVSYSKKFINDYYEIVKNKKQPWLTILNEFILSESGKATMPLSVR